MLVCWVVGVLAGLPACARLHAYLHREAPPQPTEEEVAEDMAARFRSNLAEKIVSARVLVNAGPYEGLSAMPAAEFRRLRDILSRTEAVKPARGRNEVVYVSYPFFLTLILKDAQGNEYDLPMMERLWMRKSEADALPPDRARRSDEPCWCLPDADYDALYALPTVRQSRAWGRLYSHGTTLVVPNTSVTQTPPADAPPAESEI